MNTNPQTIIETISNLDFSTALNYMKQGYYIRRKINIGIKNCWLWLFINSETNEINERHCYISLFDKTHTPVVEITKFDFNEMILRSTDILATDWMAEKLQINQ